MKTPWRKYAWWCLALSAYVLVSVLVYSAFQRPGALEVLETLAANAHWLEQSDRTVIRLNDAGRGDLQGALLLPLGGEADRLPGLPEIWAEMASRPRREGWPGSNTGFDAMQGVRDFAELAEGWTAELFLGGAPLELVRRDAYLFVLTTSGRVKVIACDQPLQPRLVGELPYRPVKQMVERNGDLYLLLGSQKEILSQMVVVSLADAAKPQELARYDLPDGEIFVFLAGERLVVLQKPFLQRAAGRGTKVTLQTLSLTGAFRLDPLGATIVPPVGGQLLAHGDYLILADLRGGLLFLDLRNLDRSDATSQLSLTSNVKQMVLSDDRLYLMGQQDDLHLLDLSEPRSPRTILEATGVTHPALLKFIDGATYYFARNGHLMVFEGVPASSDETVYRPPLAISGALLPQEGVAGFVLMGETRDPLPKLVTEVHPLPEASSVLAALVWRGQRLVLRDDGLLQSYQPGAGGEMTPAGSLKLPPGQRWLAGSAERLYVGGGSEVLSVAAGIDGKLVLAGRFPVAADATWDAVASRQTLWIAAGSGGLLVSSLVDPDRPVGLAQPIPGPLKGVSDVRQLAVAADGRVFAAAGRAGLLCFSIMADGRVRMGEYLDFEGPVVALGAIGEAVLAATAAQVHVVDAATPLSVQKLGSIPLARVERFATAPPNYWAGYVEGRGWSILPAPIRLVPQMTGPTPGVELPLPVALPAGEYRVVLYNDAGIRGLKKTYRVERIAGAAGVNHGR